MMYVGISIDRTSCLASPGEHAGMSLWRQAESAEGLVASAVVVC